MENVTSAQPYTGLLSAGRSMTVTAPASGTAFVSIFRGTLSVESVQLVNGQVFTYGPFNLDVNFKVTTSAGTATLAFQEAISQVPGLNYPATDPSKVLVATGAAAAVALGVTDVILDGVGTTFALTFPAPLGDKEVLRVMAGSAVSVAFSAVVTAPATVIKTVPSTMAAGTGVAWEYNASNTTWYRQY